MSIALRNRSMSSLESEFAPMERVLLIAQQVGLHPILINAQEQTGKAARTREAMLPHQLKFDREIEKLQAQPYLGTRFTAAIDV